jgi:hypothetical protein
LVVGFNERFSNLTFMIGKRRDKFLFVFTEILCYHNQAKEIHTLKIPKKRGLNYERIKCHRGSGKAIIATARKFLGIIYQTLKNNWIFEDFPNFVIANT